MSAPGWPPQTPWAERLGLRIPIVCAPMGGVAGGVLARAVSWAGALGTIGMGSAASPQALERELALLALPALGDLPDLPGLGGAPFGIGFVAWGIECDPQLLEIGLQAGPALVSVSFIDWAAPAQLDWIAAVQHAGALAVTQVATAEEARRAADAGVDAVVARGREGGGHGDHRRPRRALLDEVLAAVELPVLAAGAVSDAADLAEVLDAGAAAAWVGTAFSACPESLIDDAAREVLLAADGSETLVSRVLDVALDRPWPAQFPERLLRTGFVDRWHGHEQLLAADAQAKAQFRAAYAAGDFAVVPLDAGEGIGALVTVRSAAEVVASFAAGPGARAA